QPVIVAIALLVCVLILLQVDYAAYFEGASIIHFLLGTATVALALPLYENLGLIRKHARAFLITLLITGLLAPGIAILLAAMLGGDRMLLLTLAPKSITTPFALSVAETIGGYPELAASFVVLTGILVAMLASPLFRMLHIHHPAAQGSVLGMIGHGVGTARAFELDPRTGAFSALSMSLMGIYTAIGLGLLLG
ncbi:MAG: LrgB family protein, partial [Gammaproteobacteria bacterium]|nr:LrgB family protein [Gammaproteobacteria bacterium]